MSADGVGALGGDACHHAPFVVRGGFPLDDGDGPFGAVTDAGAKAVAGQVADKAGFAVDDLQSAFGAVGNAHAAPVALLVIDGDDLPGAHGNRVLLGSGGVLDREQTGCEARRGAAAQFLLLSTSRFLAIQGIMERSFSPTLSSW